MPSSNETFVGGVNHRNQNGVFAAQLSEKKEKDYTGLKAKKSYHFFDDLIVAVGSDIQGASEKYPVETVLFSNLWRMYPNLLNLILKHSVSFLGRKR